MTLIAILVAAGLGFFLFTFVVGFWRSSVMLVTGALFFAPFRLWYDDAILVPTTIGPSTLTVYGFTAVILALALAWRLKDPRSRAGLQFVPLLVLVVILALLLWPSSQVTWSGVLAILVAVCAWALGQQLGKGFDVDDGRGAFLAGWVLTLCTIELALATLQLLGFEVRSMTELSGELMGSRVNGSFGHPAALGKAMLFMTLLTLPLSTSKQRRTRRLAWASMIVIGALLILAQGRANIFAFIAIVGVWGLLAEGARRFSTRMKYFFAIMVLGISSIGVLAARFEQDPTGWTRSYFTEVALRVIPDYFFFGVGANQYLPVAGLLDPLTAEGWPVHNVFLLVISELGVVGAALFFAPLLALLGLALKVRKREGAQGLYARVLLAFVPALAIIGITGWGLLSLDQLPLWFLIMGFCAGTFVSRPTAGSLDEVAPTTLVVPSRLPKGVVK